MLHFMSRLAVMTLASFVEALLWSFDRLMPGERWHLVSCRSWRKSRIACCFQGERGSLSVRKTDRLAFAKASHVTCRILVEVSAIVNQE